MQNLSPRFAAPRFHEYRISGKDLPGSPADLPVLRVVFQDRVFFDTAQWDIRPEAEPILDAVAEALRQDRPDVALFVAGHTDSRGTEEYNLDLSIKRATSVAQALLQRGIGQAKIWRVGFGEAAPLRPNDSDANMALNRRVEFLFSARPAAVAVWLSTQMDALCADGSAAMAVLCGRFAREWRRYTAVPMLPSGGGSVVVGPGVVFGSGVYGGTVIVGGAPFPIYTGSHVFYRGNLMRRLRALTGFGPIDYGGRQYFPTGYVSLAQSACVRATDNGCLLNWQGVPAEDGGTEPYCVAYCPQVVTPAAVVSGTTIVVDGTSYPIAYGPYAYERGNLSRRFNPASGLNTIYPGNQTFHPTGYVSAAQGLCRGVAGNGCMLNWQDVPAVDGIPEPLCVAYCPQRGPDSPLPRTVELGGGGGAGCELIVYSASGLGGTSLRTGNDLPTLGQWNKQIASMRVVTGTWSFFSNDGYDGNALQLQPESYPNLNNWSNQISSFKCDSRVLR